MLRYEHGSPTPFTSPVLKPSTCLVALIGRTGTSANPAESWGQQFGVAGLTLHGYGSRPANSRSKFRLLQIPVRSINGLKSPRQVKRTRLVFSRAYTTISTAPEVWLQPGLLFGRLSPPKHEGNHNMPMWASEAGGSLSRRRFPCQRLPLPLRYVSADIRDIMHLLSRAC